MGSHSPADNYMVLETVELLLRRVGAREGDAESEPAEALFCGPNDVDYGAVSARAVRQVPAGGDRRRAQNLLSRLKAAPGGGLTLEAKARVLGTLCALQHARIVPQPGATLGGLRAAKKLKRAEGAKPVAPPAAAAAAAGLRLSDNTSVLPMSTFIRNGIYTLQGVQTDVIPADRDVAYAPHSACQVAAEQLRELGAMQDRVKRALAAKADNRSLLHQSLQHGVRQQLQDFDAAMGGLMADCDTPDKPVTLPRLLLAADASWSKGGALASALESFSHHAAAPPGLFRSLRDAAFKPLLHMVCQWVTEGVLDDPHEEFFVAKAREKDVPAGSDGWWENKYTLREAMLPPFVTPAVAEDILIAGKSINFLRQQCGDQYHVPVSVRRWLPADGAPIHPDDLPALVKAAREAVDERVLNILFDGHHLAEHLHVVRAVGLLAQGDFFEAAYFGYAGQILRLDPHEAAKRKYQLIPALEECILKTQSGAGLAIDPCKYLDVGFDLGEGGPPAAIDRFYLLFVAPQPLRTFLKHHDLQAYYKPLFQFIWRLRKLQKDLSGGRKDVKQILHARCHRAMRGRAPDWWLKLHRAAEAASHVGHAMLQLVNALCSYVLVDGVDTLWKEFEAAAKKAATLDEVIKCHRRTITYLFKHALLDGQYLELKQCVESVLGVVSEYLVKTARLQTVGNEMLLRLQDAADVAQAGIAWLNPTSSSILLIDEVAISIQHLRKRYVQEVGHLLTTLDRGLDPAKVSRETTALSHASLSPKRVHALKARHIDPTLSMGSLQRLRTALDFNNYFQAQYDLSISQVAAQQGDVVMRGS
eukprot:TRINITY_DN1953_c0_g2_i2.p1 TRINITY_DN1953_c0_g2~~TRINITY_DN1953_c0_g2_i2.p1  ORF type:complete len:815 (+),score=344.77 TRINITY_DN1953_c0_g2_i2:69-2513(+)